ncbi:otopetrin-2-like isoform X2 [Centruroides sculpturatus]|uniref:otopetrin-2-like isoform X2 n=1 Tax=Centruroides sculpturatus TaxID=218467 RepID=UPI000C6DAC4F|nr:otopetrin-2-like isoform X2 [Centruroides sculpturatus]
MSASPLFRFVHHKRQRHMSGDLVLAGQVEKRWTLGSWAGLDPPDTPPDSSDGPVVGDTKLLMNNTSCPEPTILPRSASFTLPNKSSDTPVIPVLPVTEEAESRTNIPARDSEDSGLGTNSNFNNSPHHKRPPALNLEMCIQHSPPSRTNSFIGSCISTPPTPTTSRRDGQFVFSQSDYDAMIVMLSAVYAKLLVVMGICFPLAEVISHKIPISFYEGFYLYLYLGSIAFLVYVYLFLLRSGSQKKKSKRPSSSLFRSIIKKVSSSLPPHGNSCSSFDHVTNHHKRKVDDAPHCGSFYLRLGAVAFGIGSMIYSGLEFGQFFEIQQDTACYNVLFALTPSSRMAFTFIQLYFIFLNSRMAINKYKTVARFGLMHMIATNLCVWLHVLVQETKHQIVSLNNPNETNNLIMNYVQMRMNPESVVDTEVGVHLRPEGSVDHHRTERSVDSHGVYKSHNCRRLNIMGELVQDASPFLFPCTIEYSLICAAILYVMWKNTGKSRVDSLTADNGSVHHSSMSSRHRHYYQVDCAKANKGLFTGILVLVISIISLIIFFVLINKPNYKHLAVLEAHVAELVLYVLTTLAVIIALYQVHEMKYNPHRTVDELDNILLIVAQTGLYLFTMFSIIGGHFTMDQNTVLVLLTALACLIQGTLQTIFILDASRRYARSSDQAHRKPGREMVTFLLVCNFAMWAINTLETRRADSNPVQMNFYGFWAWTIITHVTTPLTIFFRFHSTVCLCDIWKRTYKLKPDSI